MFITDFTTNWVINNRTKIDTILLI